MRLAGKTDLAAHLVDEGSGDIQAQAGPAFLAAVGRIRLRELLEYPVLKILWNTGTRV